MLPWHRHYLQNEEVEKASVLVVTRLEEARVIMLRVKLANGGLFAKWSNSDASKKAETVSLQGGATVELVEQ